MGQSKIQNPKSKITLAFGLALLLAGCSEQLASHDPKTLLDSAWQAYRAGDFSRAVKTFDAALAAAPERSELHLQALYGLATSWNLRRPDEDLQKAEALFRRLIAHSPQHDLAAWSWLALARMKHLTPVDQEPDYAAVRKAYQECMDRFPNSLAGEEAFIYQQSTLVAELEDKPAREAAAALENFIATHPRSGFLSAAYTLLAQCYQTLRRPEDFLAAKIKAVESEESDPINPMQDKAQSYWSTASIAEFEAGDFDAARKYYRRLIDDYPTDVRVFGAKAALKRMDELEAAEKANP